MLGPDAENHALADEWVEPVRVVGGAVHNYARQLAADPHKGKYKVLDLIARKYTANVGYPGFSNAAIDEIFNTWLIPQMFAQVAQGKMTPAEAARAAQHEFKPIFAKWRGRGKI